jgi:hypothetical protein
VDPHAKVGEKSAMMALSIQQPWAWMILHAGKDIENRSWQTKIRGRMLIHAAKQMSRINYAEAKNFAMINVNFDLGMRVPDAYELSFGGIIGSVEITDCVTCSSSSWWMGPVGFVLRNPRPLPFLPYKGRLGFFNVPEISE